MQYNFYINLIQFYSQCLFVFYNQVKLTHVDFKYLDRYGKTILHHAAEKGRLNVIKFLYNQVKLTPDDFRVLDWEGKTPLHHACEFGNLKIIHFQLKTLRD